MGRVLEPQQIKTRVQTQSMAYTVPERGESSGIAVHGDKGGEGEHRNCLYSNQEAGHDAIKEEMGNGKGEGRGRG